MNENPLNNSHEMNAQEDDHCQNQSQDFAIAVYEGEGGKILDDIEKVSASS